MRTDKESWAQEQCTTGVVETAAEMHWKRDKDTKSQSQAEEMQTMRRKWESVYTHLTQTATEVLDWKPSLKKRNLSGIHKMQNDLGIIYSNLSGGEKKKKECVLIKKKRKKIKKEEREHSQLRTVASSGFHCVTFYCYN